VKGRGLQIYTAIDLSAQDAAAKTIESGLKNLEKRSKRLRRSENPLEGVIIIVDVPTGEIRALVGGRNFERSQFNRALFAKRSVGSLFKPFVYLTAFEPSLSNQNITPATLVSDTRFVLKRRFAADWSPGNYENSYHGTVTVREALEQSMNSASVRIGLASGVEPILKTARTLGVTTELEDNPSIMLGAVGIPPIEMADAYSTIARQGSRLPLRTVRFVTNDRGKVLAAEQSQPVQVFPARDVFLLTHVMEGVVDRGTAGSARSLGFKKHAAGKTGTTNDKRDAWFIGFTPKTLALTWVGFDDNAPTGLSGSDSAVPIWARLMSAVTAGEPDLDFAAPSGIVFAEVDEKSGGLATPNCPARSIVNEAFKAGTEPGHLCPLHAPQSPQMPLVDQFGNPIQLDTGVMPPVDPTLTDTAYAPPPLEPPASAPDSTLTGGVFRPEPPPTAPAPAPAPPPTATVEPQPDPSLPPPSTNTSPPPG
jgi:membrane peptidoglycan carboxypeptidase